MLKHLFEYFEYNNKKEFLDNKLSKKKVGHSKRVADLVRLLSDKEDVFDAALYHDYIEAGGKMKILNNILSYYSFKLVLSLTKKEGEDTLESLKMKMSMHNQEFINDMIKIKLCDRYDNLIKRSNENNLKTKYAYKSIELIQYLYDLYSGDDKYKIENFIENKIYSIPILKNKIQLL